LNGWLAGVHLCARWGAVGPPPRPLAGPWRIAPSSSPPGFLPHPFHKKNSGAAPGYSTARHKYPRRSLPPFRSRVASDQIFSPHMNISRKIPPPRFTRPHSESLSGGFPKNAALGLEANHCLGESGPGPPPAERCRPPRGPSRPLSRSCPVPLKVKVKNDLVPRARWVFFCAQGNK